MVLDQLQNAVVRAGDPDRARLSRKSIVERRADGPNAPARLAARLQHDDGPASLPKQVRGVETGEARADDDDGIGGPEARLPQWTRADEPGPDQGKKVAARLTRHFS
jgi:hypothetical protein